jgi:homocitrate synthase NifV
LIRITDRTLSCLDGLPHDRQALSRFLALLIKTDPGAIELSERMCSLLSPLPEYPSYILRIKRAADAAKYPHIAEFLCPEVPVKTDARIRTEIRLNDTSEIDAVAGYAGCAKVRVLGMDDALCDDYLRTFARLREFCRSNIEFCPTDRSHCATALAAEWITSGAGHGIVTTFGGIGGFAPTEELIMILRMNNLRGADRIYDFFPEMASLFRKITGKNVRPNKPVIGRRIFHVESGIHVDGILKQPKCYEPFPPEAVGQARKTILGKQSGAASVRAKLSELNMEHAEEDVPRIIEMVRAAGMKKGGAVVDREFAAIVESVTMGLST